MRDDDSAARRDDDSAARHIDDSVLRRDDDSAPLRVLVLCIGNSCRSQMAEAFLARAGGSRVKVESAGTRPSVVNPMTIRVLAERGIDWSMTHSKSMLEFLDQPFDRVITVCDEAAEACPVFPGSGTRIHAGFEDPATVEGSEPVRLDAFRRIRDEIEAWADDFVRRELRGPQD